MKKRVLNEDGVYIDLEEHKSRELPVKAKPNPIKESLVPSDKNFKDMALKELKVEADKMGLEYPKSIKKNRLLKEIEVFLASDEIANPINIEETPVDPAPTEVDKDNPVDPSDEEDL